MLLRLSQISFIPSTTGEVSRSALEMGDRARRKFEMCARPQDLVRFFLCSSRAALLISNDRIDNFWPNFMRFDAFGES